MMQPTQLPHATTSHLSSTWLIILLTVGALVCYAVFVLYGAKIDGDRQKLRAQGKHPVTDPEGHVHAQEDADRA